MSRALGDRQTPRADTDGRRRWFAVVALLGLVVDVVIDPSRVDLPLCPFHAATGLWCPLCGGLRAVHALASGELSSALSDNALLVAALPAAGLALTLRRWARAGSGRPGGRRTGRLAGWATVAVFATFTVIRNLPVGVSLRPG
jgi:hypothetical protein